MAVRRYPVPATCRNKHAILLYLDRINSREPDDKVGHVTVTVSNTYNRPVQNFSLYKWSSTRKRILNAHVPHPSNRWRNACDFVSTFCYFVSSKQQAQGVPSHLHGGNLARDGEVHELVADLYGQASHQGRLDCRLKDDGLGSTNLCTQRHTTRYYCTPRNDYLSKVAIDSKQLSPHARKHFVPKAAINTSMVSSSTTCRTLFPTHWLS